MYGYWLYLTLKKEIKIQQILIFYTKIDILLYYYICCVAKDFFFNQKNNCIPITLSPPQEYEKGLKFLSEHL